MAFLRSMSKLLLPALALLGAVGAGSQTVPPADPPGLGRTAPAPVFVAGACPVEVDDGAVRCGTVSVPQNRADRASDRIALSVAILPAMDGSTNKAPTVFLHGGPGSSSIRNINRFLDSPLRASRDLILFDQRGSRFSGAFCPEIGTRIYRHMLDDLTTDQQAQAVAAEVVSCRQEARRQGIEFGNYKTSIIADDLEDIRRALGIRRWNVAGVSYGTAVGIAAAHLYPDSIRSLALDSVSPNAPDWRARAGANYDSSLERLFAICAASPDCAATFPDLRDTYDKAVARLERAPVTGHAGSPLDRTIALNKQDFQLTVHQALYSPKGIAILPYLIDRIAKGDVELARNLAIMQRDQVERMAFGVHYAIDCQGRGLDGLSLASDGSAEHLFALTAQYKRVCDAIGLPNTDPRAGSPAPSAVPTLILTGSIDPITPPVTAREGAREFSSVQWIELPNLGHGVTGSSQCARDLVDRFIDDPSHPVDGACAQDVPGIAFLTQTAYHPRLLQRLFAGADMKNVTLAAVGLVALILGLFHAVRIRRVWAKPAARAQDATTRQDLVAAITSIVFLASIAGFISAVALTASYRREMLLFGLPAWADLAIFGMVAAGIGALPWLFLSVRHQSTGLTAVGRAARLAAPVAISAFASLIILWVI
ncbi:alpha/beta fold hydrolase [Pacificimonas sp. WHA3]|uniref:Proline iminopeptidase n=1 Tax=Pacificimonas pallii TaxID=2827236 RepID=A0ABS6SHI7_9SPHN|nr:alpha/beta fold hydrolase [Pacificimonas pallii]MBV7257381.1 alpha/beta fold hydrolase [Pacificimonas pallii]